MHTDNSLPLQHVFIAGAGWAGCSAALTLVKNFDSHVKPQHLLLDIYEISPHLGGRARSFTVKRLGAHAEYAKNIHIDNGQHLLVGAYKHFWRQQKFLDKAININSHSAQSNFFLKTPPQWRFFNKNSILAEFFLSLSPFKIRARTFHLSDIYRLCKALIFKTSHAQKQETVLEWFKKNNISDNLQENFLEPLCLATLNTSIQTANAWRFHKILQQLFMRNFKNSYLYLPNAGLSEVYPQKIKTFIEKIQAKYQSSSSPLKKFNCQYHFSQTLNLEQVLKKTKYNKTLILATPLLTTLTYLNELDEKKQYHAQYQKLCSEAQASDFFKPITTVYVCIDLKKYISCHANYSQKSLQKSNARQFIDILNDRQKNWCAIGEAVFFAPPHQQFNINYTNHADTQNIFLSIVYSAAQYTQEEAVQKTQYYLQKIGFDIDIEILRASVIKVICEKRATFHANAAFNIWQDSFKKYAQTIINLQKTNGLTISIAGDYLHPDYPATLEAAVISGEEAVISVLK